MIQDLKEYTIDYAILFIMLLTGCFLYAYYSFDPQMQRIVAGILSLSFILWGVVHHHRADKVTNKIVLEYVLVAAFGFLVINSLLIGR